MDATTLRIILLVLGIILVATIYYFGQSKSQSKSKPKANKLSKNQPRKQPVFIEEEEAEETIDNNEDEMDADEAGMDADDEKGDKTEPHFEAEAPFEISETDPIDSEFSYDESTVEIDIDDDLDKSMNMSAFSAQNMASILTDDMPHFLISVSLLSKNDGFTGYEIKEAMQQMDIVFGAMDLYHCYEDDDSDKAVFSVSSMVEPGNFPEETMSTTTIPGISLFSQLPGVKDGVVIYADMLAYAKKLAVILDANLLDDSHNPLTEQSIAHTRDEILEHKRQIRLQSKRS